jgi:hypothetical protein
MKGEFKEWLNPFEGEDPFEDPMISLQNRTFVKFNGGLLEDLDIQDAGLCFPVDGKLSNR